MFFNFFLLSTSVLHINIPCIKNLVFDVTDSLFLLWFGIYILNIHNTAECFISHPALLLFSTIMALYTLCWRPGQRWCRHRARWLYKGQYILEQSQSVSLKLPWQIHTLIVYIVKLNDTEFAVKFHIDDWTLL